MSSKGENSKIFIQVSDSKPTEVMQEIIENGQEDGFYLCNVSDIIEKHKKWKYAMPRVKPYFGKFIYNIFDWLSFKRILYKVVHRKQFYGSEVKVKN